MWVFLVLFLLSGCTTTKRASTTSAAPEVVEEHGYTVREFPEFAPPSVLCTMEYPGCSGADFVYSVFELLVSVPKLSAIGATNVSSSLAIQIAHAFAHPGEDVFMQPFIVALRTGMGPECSLDALFGIMAALFGDSWQNLTLAFVTNQNQAQKSLPLISVTPPCINGTGPSLDALVHAAIGLPFGGEPVHVMFPPILAVWLNRTVPSLGPLVDYPLQWTISWAADTQYTLIGVLRRKQQVESAYSVFVMNNTRWVDLTETDNFWGEYATVQPLPAGRGHPSDMLFLYEKN